MVVRASAAASWRRRYWPELFAVLAPAALTATAQALAEADSHFRQRAELAWISKAGADVRAIFDAPTTTTVERKQLIRAVIAEVG
jgi:hypothetical protein